MCILRVSCVVPRNSVSRQPSLSPSLFLSLSRRRKELGILAVPLQPLLNPTTEGMYSHLQAQHLESLETEERNWKMELFGMDTLENQ